MSMLLPRLPIHGLDPCAQTRYPDISYRCIDLYSTKPPLHVLSAHLFNNLNNIAFHYKQHFFLLGADLRSRCCDSLSIVLSSCHPSSGLSRALMRIGTSSPALQIPYRERSRG